MCDTKRGAPDPWKLGMSVFSPDVRETRIKCPRFHKFKAFQADFQAKDLLSLSASISTINKIDHRTER